MLIQYKHLISFQSSENDFISPLKNETTVISKIKYDCKHTLLIPCGTMTAMAYELQSRPVQKVYRLHNFFLIS